MQRNVFSLRYMFLFNIKGDVSQPYVIGGNVNQ